MLIYKKNWENFRLALNDLVNGGVIVVGNLICAATKLNTTSHAIFTKKYFISQHKQSLPTIQHQSVFVLSRSIGRKEMEIF